MLECMLSLALSIVIGTILINQLVYYNHEYKQSLKIMERQFEMQWLTGLIRSANRAAGFTPCGHYQHLITRDIGGEPLGKAIQAETGKVVFSYMQYDEAQVMRIITPFHIELSAIGGVKLHSPIMIADCFHAEVHIISHIRKTAAGYIITLNTPLFYDYSLPAYAGLWVTEAFYIKKMEKGHALFYKTRQAEILSRSVQDLSFAVAGSLSHLTIKWQDNTVFDIETHLRIV